MFDLLFSQRGVAFGAGYSDVNAQLPILKVLMVLAGLVAVLCLVTIRLRSWRPLLGGVAALVGVAILGGVVYPGLIQRYRVSPNEIVTEKPYIDFNIRYTRLAYGLDNIEEREFPAEETLTLADLRRNDATIKNIRLWDTRPLLATYSQLQEIRTYYKFTDIDIDRYSINGEYRQVTLSPRELSAKELPSRIWINERLTYTHGYGAVVSPVNRVTREGLPEFWIKDIPPVASSDLRISRPELYFSELATDYVFVNTRAKEFDYPAGNQNVYTTYEGQGGIPLGSFWRKALFAALPGGPQAPPLQRPDRREPTADLPEHPGAGPADRAVLPVRRRSLHGDLGGGAHRLAPGRLHGLRPVPVLGADARPGQLRAQRRQGDRGRLRRDGALLCRRSG